MAVLVQCQQCKTTMELDEGFRGGVCRCSGCGALVQVPRSMEEGVARGARPARPEGNGGGSVAGERVGGDLGGSSSGLRGPRPVPNVARTKVPPSPKGDAKNPERTPLVSEKTTMPAVPPPPSVGAVRKNNFRLWMGISLLILIVGIIVVGVAIYVVTGEPPKIVR